jgi:MoaE-MoaD fusion protein
VTRPHRREIGLNGLEPERARQSFDAWEEIMRLTVKFFALYRDRAGVEDLPLELPDGARVEDALDHLRQAFPRLRDLPPRVLVAVNMDYAPPEQALHDGDEIALIPPVAGGSAPPPDRTAVVDRPIDASALLAEVATPAAGAQVLFLGTVREVSEGREVLSLEYEAYVPMAEKKIAEILAEARSRWDVCKMAVEHRVGKLDLGDIAVAVAVSAPHRDAAFEAGRFAIDSLKTTAPIWKREGYRDGQEWVDPNRSASQASEPRP